MATARRTTPTKKSAKRSAARASERQRQQQEERRRLERNARQRERRRLAREAEKKAEQERERRNERRRKLARERRRAEQEAQKKAEQERERRNARRRAQYAERRAELERQQKERERKERERRAAERAEQKARQKAEKQADKLRQEQERASRRGERFPRPAREGFDRIDSAGRTYHDQRIKKAEEKRREWSRKFGRDLARQAFKMEEALAFIASNLRLDGWMAEEKVRPYKDQTIDGEIRVDIPPDKATWQELVAAGGLIGRMEEHFANTAHAKLFDSYYQVGFLLPSESQVYQTTRANDQRRPYKRYEGALRFGYGYKRTTRDSETTTTTFSAARDTVSNILDKHERPLTGIYVRISWAKDGKLHRRR